MMMVVVVVVVVVVFNFTLQTKQQQLLKNGKTQLFLQSILLYKHNYVKQKREKK